MEEVNSLPSILGKRRKSIGNDLDLFESLLTNTFFLSRPVLANGGVHAGLDLSRD